MWYSVLKILQNVNTCNNACIPLLKPNEIHGNQNEKEKVKGKLFDSFKQIYDGRNSIKNKKRSFTERTKEK